MKNFGDDINGWFENGPSIEDLPTDVRLEDFEAVIKKMEEGKDKEALEFTYGEMLRYSLLYARDVFKMQQIMEMGVEDRKSAKERAQIDKERRRLHNGLIESIDRFAKTLRKSGFSVGWKEKLGNSRAAYGAFGLAIAKELTAKEEEEKKDD